MLKTATEVKSRTSNGRRVDAAHRCLPTSAGESGIVDRLIEQARLDDIAGRLLVRQDQRHSESAIVVEAICERSTFQERGEAGTGHRFEAGAWKEGAGLGRWRGGSR